MIKTKKMMQLEMFEVELPEFDENELFALHEMIDSGLTETMQLAFLMMLERGFSFRYTFSCFCKRRLNSWTWESIADKLSSSHSFLYFSFEVFGVNLSLWESDGDLHILGLINPEKPLFSWGENDKVDSCTSKKIKSAYLRQLSTLIPSIKYKMNLNQYT